MKQNQKIGGEENYDAVDYEQELKKGTGYHIVGVLIMLDKI